MNLELEALQAARDYNTLLINHLSNSLAHLRSARDMTRSPVFGVQHCGPIRVALESEGKLKAELEYMLKMQADVKQAIIDEQARIKMLADL